MQSTKLTFLVSENYLRYQLFPITATSDGNKNLYRESNIVMQ